MITEIQLKILCTEYGIDYEKLIKGNKNEIFQKGNYEEIKKILEFLRKEVKIAPRNVEKCVSILYISSKEEIERNWKFLKEKEITISNVENCLHVLSSPNKELKKHIII